MLYSNTNIISNDYIVVTQHYSVTVVVMRYYCFVGSSIAVFIRCDYRFKGVVNCQNSREKGPPEGNSARG